MLDRRKHPSNQENEKPISSCRNVFRKKVGLRAMWYVPRMLSKRHQYVYPPLTTKVDETPRKTISGMCHLASKPSSLVVITLMQYGSILVVNRKALQPSKIFSQAGFSGVLIGGDPSQAN